MILHFGWVGSGFVERHYFMSDDKSRLIFFRKRRGRGNGGARSNAATIATISISIPSSKKGFTTNSFGIFAPTLGCG